MSTTKKRASDGKIWQDIVTPRVPLFAFPLKEIWERRYMLYLFIRQSFVSMYKQTILGPVWAIVQPLLNTFIFILVFDKVLHIYGGGTVPPVLFYLLSNILWYLFNNTFLTLTNFLQTYSDLFTKVSIQKQIIALSIVAKTSMTVALQFVVFLGFWSYYLLQGMIEPKMSLLCLLPVVYVCLVLFTLGAGYVAASLSFKYRDIQNVYAYLAQVMMYVSPVIYPLAAVDAGTKRLFLQLNPLSGMLEFTRYAFFGQGEADWWLLLYACVCGTAVFLIGMVFINRVEKNYADVV